MRIERQRRLMVDVSGLPRPLVPEQRYMAAMCGLLAEQNDLLREICDRLPERATDGQPDTNPVGEMGGAVELREPAAPPALAAPAKAEPDDATRDLPEPVALTEPTQPPAKKTARKAATKTTAARRRTTKETS